MDKQRPNLFIVGAPKCGTSSLWHYLNEHPDVFMSKIKEPHFFGGSNVRSYPKVGLDQYLSFFSDVKEERIVGEASTWYLYSEEACKNIHHFNPDSKIIIMIRPIHEMLYSLHAQMVYIGHEVETDFIKALMLESVRKKGKRIPRSAHTPNRLFYSEFIDYSRYIKNYLKVFGEQNVLIIDFLDFKKDPEGIYFKVLEFLKIEQIPLKSYEIVNQSKKLKFPIIKQMVNQIRGNFDVKRFSKFIPLYRSIWHMMHKAMTKKSERKSLDEEAVKFLTVNYNIDIELLRGVTGLKLEGWK